MSALAHFFEEEGLSTVVVALVREHAEAMRPPRALWVTYELGRPFGAPNDPALQTHVLRVALSLLDHDGPAPILIDDMTEPPFVNGDPDWRPPAALDQQDVRREAASILPVHARARQRFGRTTTGISGLDLVDAVTFIARYHDPDPMPNPRGMAPVSRARFAIDDIKAWYLEAAAAEGGNPSSGQLQDWFWDTTLAGELIQAFQEQAKNSDDSNLKLIAGSLVPAERVNALRG